ncbi:uncharacterized protein LOC135849378 [Planococcus citri]|uniref:uncharacterized protein LOC135849378 n=1 Tax=Planococcus citri TaxID=170843 RepID=UPI0031F7DCFD
MFLHIIVILGLFIINIEVEAAKKYDYVGCYDTSDKAKLLYQYEKKDDKLAPRSCVDFCHSKQSAYAAIIKNVCRCGHNQPPDIVKRVNKECDYSCPGDKNLKCGGEFKSSVYETGLIAQGNDAIPSRIYLGCYKDNDTNYRLLRGSFQESVDNTPTKCHRICYKQGFRYFGLFNRQCLCDDTAPSKETALSDDDCQAYCYEDDTEFCGGKSTMSLYSTGISDIPEYGRYVGCYNNEKNNNIKPDITMNFTQTNSNRRCWNICDQKGYKYAGIQSGVLCMCMTQAPPTSLHDDDHKCDDIKCPGDILDGCGARDVMKVFKTRRADEIQAAASRYLGCYKDDKPFPTLEGIKEIFEKTLTPELCSETCGLRGYAFSGVETGNECYCSHSFPSVILRVADSECSSPCSGSQNDRCGGYHRIAVYDNGVPHPQAFVHPSYMGCYKEDEPGIRLLEGISDNLPNLTPSLCHKQCLQAGFLYFGLSTSADGIGKCMCSDQTPPESVFTRDSECQKKCNGNPNKVCGGDWRVAVYRTGLSNAESEYVYKGCYENTGNILLDRKSHQTRSLTPKRCHRFCDMLEFKYSVVEEGKICGCGNEAPSSGSPKPDASCRLRCPGNFSETCGGHKKHMQVYGIVNESDKPDQVSEDELNQLMFSDTFDFMDPAIWYHTVKIAHEPNYEFVTYERCHHVIYLREGVLFIKPRVQPHAFIEKDSTFTLENCTGKVDECTKKSEKFIILPPIQSGQISTERSFRFLYGKVEVQAKLPVGDWIVPQIWLMPATKEYGDYYQSGQIRIAMSRGNADFHCSDDHFGYRRLEMGVYLSDHAINVKKKVFYKEVSEDWPNKYHNFSVTWTPDLIAFHVDGEEVGMIQPEAGQTMRQIVGLPESDEYIYKNSTNKMAPFDREFHLTLGVSVGGISDFPDECKSTPKKPWTNRSPKGMLNFWKDRDNWRPTWKDEEHALQVEHVKVWAVENNFI